MPASHKPTIRSSSSLFSLLALICMAAVISGLIIVNYSAQNSLHKANIRRFQQNLEDRGRSLEYFFSERENDLRAFAGSSVITAFFANRALGMTMAYGLKASLNNIDRLFKERGENSRLGSTAIYSKLLLLAEDGQILSQWPETADRDRRQSPYLAEYREKKVVITDQGNGLISFTCPVYANDHFQGFVQGWVRYETIVEYLLRDMPGILVVTHHGDVVYKTLPGDNLSLDRMTPAIEGRQSPVLISPDQLQIGARPEKNDSDFTIFFVPVPGYNMQLLVIEDGSVINQQRSQLYSLISLIVLSMGAFGAAALVLRAGSRRLILETSLVEANKRERAIAEKKEELELVLEGAQLGTWSWNPLDNQVEFNKRYWTMLGFPPLDGPAHLNDWKQLLHPDDAPAVVAALEAHAAGISPFFSMEYRMRHKSGSWVWIHDTGKVVQRDQNGLPSRAFGIHLDITERKQSNHLLAKAKEESDAIIRDFLDTLIVVNTYLTVIRVNQATCDLLGYTEEELLGRKVSDLFHDTAEHIQSVFAFYAHKDPLLGQAKEELRNVELCYCLKNGDRLPMSFNVRLLKNDEGIITGVVAGAKDISHLRLAMDRIAEQKEYIETLFDIVPSGLVALSTSQEVTESNRAFRQLVAAWANHFGIPEEECLQRFVHKMLTAQSENDAFTIELSQGHFSGYFRCNSSYISVLDGVASVVSIEDITDERKAEEERRLLATVIGQTGDSVYITGTDDLVQYVNPAAVRNSGYSESELLGQLPLIFRDDRIENSTVAALKQAMAAGKIWHGRFTLARKDGTVMEEDTTVSPVRNDEGEVTHFVAIKRDVSEIANLQRQLLQSQKLEAIGQLAAGIAHEINTPMQYVQNNVSFFEQSFIDIKPLLQTLENIDPLSLPQDAQQELEDLDLPFLLEEIPASIEETLDGIGRVVKIVSAMKEFSHPGGNERETIDINHAIESTLIVCRNEYKYDAELETDFDPKLPLIPCFPDQLNQVILNLTINAAHAIQHRRKSQPDPPGRITVSTRRDGDWAEIRLSDNGSGIPEEIKQRIFDPFFTTKEVGKGTGQGLTIAHDIMVNKHGGDINFTSTPGQGTIFILRLPISP